MYRSDTLRRATVLVILGVLAAVASLRAEEPTPGSGALKEAVWGCEEGERPVPDLNWGGGLIIQIDRAAELESRPLVDERPFLMELLETTEEGLALARKVAEHPKNAGRVTAARLSGDRLPYAESIVNSMRVRGELPISVAEVSRVLRPGGACYWEEDGRRRALRKPWPDEIDEWTHFLHTPSNNAVSQDERVGPPRQIQWQADPLWSRNHHKLASMSAMVTAAGLLFQVVDEGPAGSMEVPGRWFLVARDAFNGARLWKKPISTWEPVARRFRSGPVHLPRLLVATSTKTSGPLGKPVRAATVYAKLGLNAPIMRLAGKSGDAEVIFDGTEQVEEFIVHDGLLLATAGDPNDVALVGQAKRRGKTTPPPSKSLLAFRAENGERLWERTADAAGHILPLTLAASGGNVYYQNRDAIACVSLEDGRQRWSVPCPAPSGPNYFAPTVVAQPNVVLAADGKTLRALGAEDGALLWQCSCKATFHSPVDVFVQDDVVWLGPDFSEGRDLSSGEVVESHLAAELVQTAGHHHRCFRNKATCNFILGGYRGIEFYGLAADEYARNNWVRGTCQYGVMPANGFLYVPPHACGCYNEAKIRGMLALAPKSEQSLAIVADGARLERGPGFDAVSLSEKDAASDWPTYRHDAARSGSTATQAGRSLQQAWAAALGGELSPPIAAGDKIFISQIDAHRVVALSAADGSIAWTFTAGARVDSPPTYYDGLLLFGAADGCVYCLDARDGALVWRFLAAPNRDRTIVRERVESLWPVRGSVLVQNGVAYAAAGRSSYLDGGITLWALDPLSGRVQYRQVLQDENVERTGAARATDTMPREKLTQNTVDGKTLEDPDRSDAFSMHGHLNDVLVGDGASIYLRHHRFDEALQAAEGRRRHLFSTSSLLDDAENHRSHWVFGFGNFSRLPVAYSWIANRHGGAYGVRLCSPYGLMLAFDDDGVWGVRKYADYDLFHTPKTPSKDGAELDFRPVDDPIAADRWTWSERLDFRPHAMVRAGNHLLVAGMPMLDKTNPHDSDAFEGRGPGLLRVFSEADGSPGARYDLPSAPVWDGMAVTPEGVFIAMRDGSVACLAESGD